MHTGTLGQCQALSQLDWRWHVPAVMGLVVIECLVPYWSAAGMVHRSNSSMIGLAMGHWVAAVRAQPVSVGR